MNEIALGGLAGSVAILGICLWRSIGALSAGMRESARSHYRDRLQQDKMVTRLIEKSQCDPDKTAHMHAQERIAETRMDEQTERRIYENLRNRRPVVDEPPPVERETEPTPFT